MARKPKTARKRRPAIFVASSSEGLDVAYAIQENLQQDADTTVWPQGVFGLSQTNLASLTAALEHSDFGVFVFTPDDRVRLRKKTLAAVRDNVVFELGLFTGRLGPQRVFIVVPDRASDMRIPTDLTGITPGKYDPNRPDKNLHAALGPFCNQVRRALRSWRLPKPRVVPVSHRRRPAHIRGLVVHSAEYGVGASWRDVKQPLVQRLKRFGTVRVDNKLAGDPQRGTAKTLRMDFTYRGERHHVEIPEGNVVEFPR